MPINWEPDTAKLIRLEALRRRHATLLRTHEPDRYWPWVVITVCIFLFAAGIYWSGSW